MIVVEWDIKKVKPYPGNPRRQDEEAVEKVAASIKEFSFQQPIVVDKDGVIIVGHTRLKAAKKLKLKVVPVVVAAGLSPDQVRAYRLADNKVAEFSEWDADKLFAELKLTEGIKNLNMGDFGFDAVNAAQIDKLREKISGVRKIKMEDVAEDNPKIKSFIEARKGIRKRIDDHNEVNFWLCLTFQSRAQKMAFLEKIGLEALYGMYVDAEALCDKMKIEIPKNMQKPRRSNVRAELAARALP